MLVLYSSSSCSRCLQLKKYFKNNNIVYEEKCIDDSSDNKFTNIQALKDLTDRGFYSIPVINLNGNFVGSNINDILDAIRDKK
jgi:glutaredoxin